tara:strand:+ start:1207 stop:1347 length:141 start_codon:yes stop_codon:yes gene_type:complete
MAVNKAKQHRSLRSLDSLALAPFVHGFAITAQWNYSDTHFSGYTEQ